MQKTTRLVRKLLILAVLLAGLAGLNGDLVTRAEAYTCDECESRYDSCIAVCADYQSACPIFCQSRYNSCVRYCTP